MIWQYVVGKHSGSHNGFHPLNKAPMGCKCAKEQIPNHYLFSDSTDYDFSTGISSAGCLSFCGTPPDFLAAPCYMESNFEVKNYKDPSQVP